MIDSNSESNPNHDCVHLTRRFTSTLEPDIAGNRKDQITLPVQILSLVHDLRLILFGPVTGLQSVARNSTARNAVHDSGPEFRFKFWSGTESINESVSEVPKTSYL